MRVSAGVLLYRRTPSGLELLLTHPGGPYFKDRDEGHWTIPKGEPDAGESLPDAAIREFDEETGCPLPVDAARIELGSITQKGGKVVTAWGIEGDLDPRDAHSNVVEIEWPPRSGRVQAFPEIDRVAWFEPAAARRRIKDAQVPLIDRLETALAAGPALGEEPAQRAPEDASGRSR
jgi:predicted NUDIX family NTP pyrophosphohydrolase